MKDIFKGRRWRDAGYLLATAGMAVGLLAAFAVVEAVGMRSFPEDGQLGILLANAFLAACLAPLAVHGTRRGPGWEPDVPGLKMTGLGWTLLACVFLLMYVAVEMTGIWLGSRFPDFGTTGAYLEMQERDVLLYLVRAVTVTPFVEEFVARYVIFRRVRSRFGFWPGFAASALYFSLLHGTIMHLPLAIGLTFFLCTLYSVTGRFRYCVAFHMAFNWCGSALVFSVDGMPVWSRFALLGLSYGLLLALYAFRKYLFGTLFQAGVLDVLEGRLSASLDRLADKAESAGGKRGGSDPGD